MPCYKLWFLVIFEPHQLFGHGFINCLALNIIMSLKKKNKQTNKQTLLICEMSLVFCQTDNQFSFNMNCYWRV